MTQPNIVVIMADQLAPHFTGAYDIGQLNNTLVIVTADHGDMLGKRSRPPTGQSS